MRIPSISKHAVAALALVVMAGFAPAVTHAQDRYDRYGNYDRNGMYDRHGHYLGGRTRSGMYVFRRAPQMRLVAGTNVYVVDRNRYDVSYDAFRLGNRYYVYNDGQWYWANTWRGPFVMIDDRRVPMAFRDVPRQYWHSYPSGWMRTGDNRYGSYYDNRDRGYYDRRDRGVVEAPVGVFRSAPEWRAVPGTRVYVVNRAYSNPDYDAFRYGDTYYLYGDGGWFTSQSWQGPFVSIDDQQVPYAFRSVPRDEWRNSPPSGWLRVNVRTGY